MEITEKFKVYRVHRGSWDLCGSLADPEVGQKPIKDLFSLCSKQGISFSPEHSEKTFRDGDRRSYIVPLRNPLIDDQVVTGYTIRTDDESLEVTMNNYSQRRELGLPGVIGGRYEVERGIECCILIGGDDPDVATAKTLKEIITSFYHPTFSKLQATESVEKRTPRKIIPLPRSTKITDPSC